MKLLVLGGTSDAIKLSKQLIQAGHDVIYSIKGIVRKPNLECSIHVGGFGGVGGLSTYLQQHRIEALLDVTHPYAINISNNAKQAASFCGLPCIHYVRPAWQQQDEDNWIGFETISKLPSLLKSYRKPFFTIGQLAPELVQAKFNHQKYLVRSAIAQAQLIKGVSYLESIGPFALEDEFVLFKNEKVDALVSKNSGGHSVAAKIEAARVLRLPIFMMTRPILDSEFPQVATLEAMLLAIEELNI